MGYGKERMCSYKHTHNSAVHCALQITYKFQPKLGKVRTATIEAGTEIRIGLVGGQRGMEFGTWLQIHSKTPIKFTP